MIQTLTIDYQVTRRDRVDPETKPEYIYQNFSIAPISGRPHNLHPMALHRRRQQQQHHYRVRYLVATVSAAVIFLFFLLNFLSPYPTDDDETLRRHLQQNSVDFAYQIS